MTELPSSKSLPIWALPLLVFVAVCALIWVVKPKQTVIVWHKLHARPETRRIHDILNAAEQQRPQPITPGTYHYLENRNGLTLSAQIAFPKGATPQNRTPFTYLVTLSSKGHKETQQAQGQATVKGEVLYLLPSTPTPLLNTVDRTLLRDVGPQGFVMQSSGQPESQNPDDRSVFVRR